MKEAPVVEAKPTGDEKPDAEPVPVENPVTEAPVEEPDNAKPEVKA